MPLFFFDHRFRSGLEPDDTGREFDSIEIAYIEACRGNLSLTAELLRVSGPQDQALDRRRRTHAVARSVQRDPRPDGGTMTLLAPAI